jgi:hypothetical protein
VAKDRNVRHSNNGFQIDLDDLAKGISTPRTIIAIARIPPITTPTKISNGEEANLVAATIHIGYNAIAPKNVAY